MLGRWPRLLAPAAFLVLAVARPAAAQYILTDLGTIDQVSGHGSCAYGINASGQVVGWAAAAGGNPHAFLWSPNLPNTATGTLQDLGTLGGMQSVAYGINFYGRVVGQSATGAVDGSGNPILHGFLTESNAAIDPQTDDLYTLGGNNSAAFRISDSVLVAGTAQDANGVWWSTLWDGATTQNLGALSSSVTPIDDQANGINASGLLVGQSITNSGVDHAFLYNGSMTDLTPSLTGSSAATAINASGQVAGVYTNPATNEPSAFVWTNGTLTDIGTLGISSTAHALNSFAQVVGESATSTNGTHAFLYLNGGIIDLNTLLPANSGWTLVSAYDINDGGQIVGVGNGPNGSHAFLLTPSPAVKSISCMPGSPVGSKTATGKVVLTAAAPGGGAIVNLASSNTTVAAVPQTVTVAAGATSATFPITTTYVSTPTTVTLTAARAVTKSLTLTVQPISLSKLTLTPSTVTGSNSVIGKVGLNGPAPLGGIVVSLSNTNPAATVPSSVTVKAGASSVSFTIKTVAVTTSTTGTVTASYNGVTRSVLLTVQPIGVKSLTLTPSSVTGGGNSTAKVTLTAPAGPGAVTVNFTDNDGSITPSIPASITIPAGSTSGTYPITTRVVTTTTQVTIHAAANGISKSAVLTVNP
ncbi:MAG TPA: hypothetical protein VFA07_08360 [Chthonomonadaceae bacterium]|nr:hypothetical protein [Chthonomonadaceae bacterium]